MLSKKELRRVPIIPQVMEGKITQVDKVVEAIAKTAHTGNPGDGKVFVYDIEKAVRR